MAPCIPDETIIWDIGKSFTQAIRNHFEHKTLQLVFNAYSSLTCSLC